MALWSERANQAWRDDHPHPKQIGCYEILDLAKAGFVINDCQWVADCLPYNLYHSICTTQSHEQWLSMIDFSNWINKMISLNFNWAESFKLQLKAAKLGRSCLMSWLKNPSPDNLMRLLWLISRANDKRLETMILPFKNWNMKTRFDDNWSNDRSWFNLKILRKFWNPSNIELSKFWPKIKSGKLHLESLKMKAAEYGKPTKMQLRVEESPY